MLTATLFILFAVAGMIALAVLADAGVRGQKAYMALSGQRASLGRSRSAQTVVLSVWTKEHAPSRPVTVETSRELAAA